MECETHELRKMYIWQYKPKKALVVVGQFCTNCYHVDITLEEHALEIEKESDKYLDEIIIKQDQELDDQIKKLEVGKNEGSNL